MNATVDLFLPGDFSVGGPQVVAVVVFFFFGTGN